MDLNSSQLKIPDYYQCLSLRGMPATDGDVVVEFNGSCGTDHYPFGSVLLNARLGGQEGKPVQAAHELPDLVDHVSEQLYMETVSHPRGQNIAESQNPVDHVFEQYAENEFQVTDQHYFAVW